MKKLLTPFSITLTVFACLWSLIKIGYDYTWTGFGAITYTKGLNQEVIPPKTLWDWLGLLIIPVVIALSATIFAWMERRSEYRIADERIAQDRKIADERAQDAALEAYLAQMSILLLDKELRTSEANSEERDLARTWTLTVLRRLSGERKGLVLRFLYESKLITGVESIVSLSGANFEGANLVGAYLADANLARVTLVNAHLARAYLVGANFARANLVFADLAGANLAGTNLAGANLTGAIYTAATVWPTGFDPVAAVAKFSLG
jgi:hypothetical protein